MNSILLLVLAGFSILSFVSPGPDPKELDARLVAYNKANPSHHLFLHLDKSVYSQNEDVWIKAYLLSGTVLDNEVLYVRLANERKELMIAEQFPVYDLRAHGELMLPDTLKDGTYYLYAYTDRMINFKKEDIFVQKIKVQRGAARRLEAIASVVDSSKIRRGQKIQVLIQLQEGIKLLKNVRGRYELIVEKKVIKAGRITTNNFGEATIEITYPQITDDQTLKVRAIFDRNSDFAELNLNLRHEGNSIHMKAYPEGGHLLRGFTNRIIIETLDVSGYPLSTQLGLMEDGTQIKEVSTDKYGIASLELNPLAGKTYTIKPLHHKHVNAVNLEIEEAGYGITIHKKDNKLIACLKNREDSENVTLVVRTLEEVLITKPVKIKKGDSSFVSFVFQDVPKNVLSFFVIDSDNKVKSERLVLRPGEEDFRVDMSTDEKSMVLERRLLHPSRFTIIWEIRR